MVRIFPCDLNRSEFPNSLEIPIVQRSQVKLHSHHPIGRYFFVYSHAIPAASYPAVSLVTPEFEAVLMALYVAPAAVAVAIVGWTVGAVAIAVPGMFLFGTIHQSEAHRHGRQCEEQSTLPFSRKGQSAGCQKTSAEKWSVS